MLDLLKKLRIGLSTQGPGYLLRVWRNELAHPRLGITRSVRRALVAVFDRTASRPMPEAVPADNRLAFVYDFDVCPVTFDFASYLAAAEMERRSRGLAGLHVYFVPGSVDGLRREAPDYEKVVPPETRKWRIRNLIIPMLSLLPSVKGYTVCDTRRQADQLIPRDSRVLYPADYRVYLPRQPLKRAIHDHARNAAVLPMFRTTSRARALVDDFLKQETAGRKPIVITLRDYDYNAERNSRVDDWISFADSLDRREYAAVFVFDSETMKRAPRAQLEKHTVCEAASFNLEMRMALYSAAWLNMAVMHGPMELCWYHEDVRYLIFLKTAASGENSELMIAESGQPLYSDLEFATPVQRFVWDEDRLDVLEQEFRKMERVINDAADQRRHAG